MDEYSKTIKLSFDIDEKSLAKVDKALDEVSKQNVNENDAISKFRKQLSAYKDETKKLTDLQKLLSDANNLTGETAEKARKELQQMVAQQEKAVHSLEKTKPSVGTDLKQFAADKLKSLATWFVNKLEAVFKDAWSEFSEIVNYSKLSNARTRELAFGYGFTGSQAYGFDKALSTMGLSESDLMYLDKGQRDRFVNLMTKYSEQYSKLYDSGFFDKYLQYQYDMQDLKNELLLEVVDFFSDNKDTIVSGMKMIIKFGEAMLKVIGWISQAFSNGGSVNAAKATDSVRNSTVNNSNTNVTLNNTFNNVDKTDRTWLANAGQLTYAQVIRALGG